MSSNTAPQNPRLAPLHAAFRGARRALRRTPTSTWVVLLWFTTLAALWACIGIAVEEALPARTGGQTLQAVMSLHTAVSITAAVTCLLSGATWWLVRRLQRLERAHAALARSAAEARTASRQQIERLNALPHTLHAPLASIRGLAELIQRRIEHPLYREQAALISRGAHQVETLLGEVLEQARDSLAMPLDETGPAPQARRADQSDSASAAGSSSSRPISSSSVA